MNDTSKDPVDDPEVRARWLISNLQYMNCELSVVSHPDAPIGLKLEFPDRMPEGAREPIKRQVGLLRHEIADALLGEGEDTGAGRSQTGRGPPQTGAD